LLEGLGGSWEATEALLTTGGMQWAYSEIFQNYSGQEVAWYLDYALRQSERVGLYVHYSETHDNNRLAAQRAAASAPGDLIKPDRAWSLLRNQLCALTSVSGGFGFTSGVEWLATEKIRVHGSTGLAWGNRDNIIAELAQLNRLLAEHPCFFDGAKLTRVSPPGSAVYALRRESAAGADTVVVLANTDIENRQLLTLRFDDANLPMPDLIFDLLGQTLPEITKPQPGQVAITLPPGAVYCLSATAQPVGLSGDAYRRARAQSAWAIQAMAEQLPAFEFGNLDWRTLAAMVNESPVQFIGVLPYLDREMAGKDLIQALQTAAAANHFSKVIRWNLLDCRRITPVPPDHWLLIEDSKPFRASLHGNGARPRNVESIPSGVGHVACFPPREHPGDASLLLERYADSDQHVEARLRFLAAGPAAPASEAQLPSADSIALLTNGIGGMARLCVDLGRVRSKYDCVLGANLHPTLPVDRHVFAKRIRVWVNADGFISPLDFQSLVGFQGGPPAIWNFVANAGDGRTVQISLRAEMIEGQNTTVFHFSRPTAGNASGKQLPADADVRLTVRVDIEDRNFHSETQRNGGSEYHFATHTRPLDLETMNAAGMTGFAFTPAIDRQLRVFADAGEYHPAPEWGEPIPHPVEQTRGQTGSGDAYSPGWFEIPMTKGAEATLVVTAELGQVPKLELPRSVELDGRDPFEQQLQRAASSFVVRRGAGKTVIAGYPWFLDWGRDTFICARGLLAGGMVQEVQDILITFARFEKDGTLPNTIFGDDASNRDTSDAPLWFGIVCEELASAQNKSADLYSTAVGQGGRTIRDVLKSIAENYIKGTPNGIRMDADSGLIWSPSHFTWMDTNYPAATPREGYPIELQALWIRLLRQLAAISEKVEASRWNELASRALDSLEKYFWLEDRGWYADLLVAKTGQAAASAIASDALRSNCLLAISLGIVAGPRAKQCVSAVQRYLVIPGALRSLAPLPVATPLPVYGNYGGLLNTPTEPYWGQYEGDEDTRRKPAYHNGTAWTWTFPVFCEALVRAWEDAPEAIAAARAYLGSMDRIMREGCIGQIPEVLDGDAPHTQRGCDAQAWGATEALRVWKQLQRRDK
ncbi:MAG: amylo-alpha-1,6-glucosidase, partial [Verrucomicrobiota bacterium]